MADAAHSHAEHDHPGFFTRWFMSTNHKDIGILYLVTAAVLGFIAVAFTMYMRLELMHPGVQYMLIDGLPNGHLWNVLVTGHGILMMFFVVIPALFGGFGNYFMPLMIGAPDMAFPRMNNLSYWLYVAGSTLAVLSLFAPGGNGQLGSGRRLGALPAALHHRAGHVDGSGDLRGAPLGRLLDPRRDQHDHDLHEHARAGHDAVQGAALRLVDRDHRLHDPAGAAGARRRDHHAAHRPQLRHHLLRSLRRRRPGALPAHPVVLRPPGGLHHHRAGLRHRLPRDRDLLAQADLRLPADGLRDDRHRRARLRGLGAPHVHGRHVDHPAELLHAGDHGDRGADRHQDLLLDRDDVGRLGRVQDADALGARASCSSSRWAASPASC